MTGASVNHESVAADPPMVHAPTRAPVVPGRWRSRIAWMLIGAVLTLVALSVRSAAIHEPLEPSGGTMYPATVAIATLNARPLPVDERAAIGQPELRGSSPSITVRFEPGKAFYANYVVYAGGRWGVRVEDVLVDQARGLPYRIERVLMADSSDRHVRRRPGGGHTQGPVRTVAFSPFDLAKGESRLIHVLIRMTDRTEDGSLCQPAVADSPSPTTTFAPAPRVRYRSARLFTHEMRLYTGDWGIAGADCDRGSSR